MKNWKIILVITILTICLLMLSSCSTTDSSSQSNTNLSLPTATPTIEPPIVSTFKIINSAYTFYSVKQYILYDPETMVMYTALYDNGVNEVGLTITPMYNADGSLRLYNPNGIFEKQ